MAVHFHPLIIKHISKETPDSVVITFDVPAKIQELFQYSQGQNLTLKASINGEEIRRSYSICSAPFENKISIAIKRAPLGKFSGYANDYLQTGDTLQVLPPTGRFFTKLKPTNKKNYLAFAAGSGITPIISIIKTTLSTEPLSLFTLVYGNRSRTSIMFFEELEGLKNKYVDRFNFINILSREKTDSPLNFGRIGHKKLTELTKLIAYNSFDDTFICGPESMLFCVKDFLEEKRINKKNIHFELFTTPGQKELKPLIEKEEKDKLPKNKVTIKLDGRSFSFDLAANNDSILDAALKLGVDLPFACKGGVCGTCRAKITEGQVDMDINYALESEEVHEGFILTCQAHPITKNVMVDFDLR